MRPPLIERTRAALRDGLSGAASRCGWNLEAGEVALDPPREASHGDLSTSAALILASREGERPRGVAERIRTEFLGDPGPAASLPVAEVEVAGPGFLNFRMTPSWLESSLSEVLEAGAGYGRTSRMAGRSIHFEFVSANPTGPLNIVSARAAAVGDALAALCEAAGGRAAREFYVNDAGRQVALLGMSLEARIRQAQGEEASIPPEGYHGQYLADLARDFLSAGPPDWWERPERAERVAAWAVERIVASQRAVLVRFGLTFDRWFHESELHSSGAVTETLEDLRARGSVFEADGAVWFRATGFGDDKDRVIITSEGHPTYLLPDIAYHRDKYARGWETLVDIWGPDHHGYIPRMSAALQALGHPADTFRVLVAQQVNLMRGSEIVKMSKRSGRLIEMEDLLDEVGVDATRFLFLQRSLSSHLDFDLDLAVAHSEENPVYYVQYAHARICSILQKAASEGVTVAEEIAGAEHALLSEKESRALLRLLAQFPEIVADAALSFEPHRVPAFLRDLAAAFHPFYHQHQVVGSDGGRQGARLALCQGVRTVLAAGLSLLGVAAPDRM